MASPIAYGLAAALLSLSAGSALACPDLAACGGMSYDYGYYSEQASFGPMVENGPQDMGDGPAYGPGDQGPPPPYGPPPPPYGPQAYGPGPYGPPPGYQGQAYEQEGSAQDAYADQRRGARYASRISTYDSGWRRLPGRPPVGFGSAVSVEEHDYDSGWRGQGGRVESGCAPVSGPRRPDLLYGCPTPIAEEPPQAYADANLPLEFFYDNGGVGPAFISDSGGGGGGMVIAGGGARAGAFAFASAHASASARVHIGLHGGGHWGHGGGHGCGCGGHGHH